MKQLSTHKYQVQNVGNIYLNFLKTIFIVKYTQATHYFYFIFFLILSTTIMYLNIIKLFILQKKKKENYRKVCVICGGFRNATLVAKTDTKMAIF